MQDIQANRKKKAMTLSVLNSSVFWQRSLVCQHCYKSWVPLVCDRSMRGELEELRYVHMQTMLSTLPSALFSIKPFGQSGTVPTL